MTEDDRERLQRAFIHVCRDSDFTLSPVTAAIFAAQVLRRSPLEIWMACAWNVMERIADGTHPALADPRFK